MVARIKVRGHGRDGPRSILQSQRVVPSQYIQPLSAPVLLGAARVVRLLSSGIIEKLF